MAVSYKLRYSKADHARLRRCFPGSETIEGNFAQAFQDLFVLSVLDGKQSGFYVEIGGNHGIVDNNSYLLETLFGWQGVSVEISQTHVDGYNAIRKNKCVWADALKVDYKNLLKKRKFPRQIDYLSLDIEPALQTFKVLEKMPHEDHRFTVITFETELYSTGDGPQKAARDLLLSLGYELVIENVCILGRPFEDWYVDPLVVPSTIIEIFRRNGQECEGCVLQDDSVH